MSMWHNCWNGMTSLGWPGLFLGTALLVALTVLIVVLLVRTSGGERPRSRRRR